MQAGRGSRIRIWKRHFGYGFGFGLGMGFNILYNIIERCLVRNQVELSLFLQDIAMSTQSFLDVSSTSAIAFRPL